MLVFMHENLAYVFFIKYVRSPENRTCLNFNEKGILKDIEQDKSKLRVVLNWENLIEAAVLKPT